MTTTVIDAYILPVLIRYIDRYRWSWNISMRTINMYYGTEYTEKELKKLYQQAIKNPRSAERGKLNISGR